MHTVKRISVILTAITLSLSGPVTAAEKYSATVYEKANNYFLENVVMTFACDQGLNSVSLRLFQSGRNIYLQRDENSNIGFAVAVIPENDTTTAFVFDEGAHFSQSEFITNQYDFYVSADTIKLGKGNIKGILLNDFYNCEVNLDSTVATQARALAEAERRNEETAVNEVITAKYASLSIEELLLPGNSGGLQLGQKIYQKNCSGCHGETAIGTFGVPNLTDKDWLYGGSPETVKTTVYNGREGGMPAWDGVLNSSDVSNVTEYVLSLSGRSNDRSAIARGKETFETLCAACHMPNGTGMHALGAPNLADNIWLYGGTKEQIADSIQNGRAGVMPAFREQLSSDQIHLLAAYVVSLSLD